MKRSHSRKNEESFSTYNVTIGIKCKERKSRYSKPSYVMKNNKSFSTQLSQSTTYEQLHDIARKHYRVRTGRITYLDLHKENRTSFQNSLITIAQYVSNRPNKDKKKSIQVYLYYPKSYEHLEFRIFHIIIN